MQNKEVYFCSTCIFVHSIVLFWVGGSYAADSTKSFVNGKELDSISDIMRETNGGNSGIPKYSALILSTVSEQSQKLSWQIKGFNSNGQANQNYSNYNQPFGDDNSWTTPVTAKYLTGQSKGRYAVLISSPAKSGNIASFRAQTYLISKQDNTNSAPTFTKIGNTITKTLGDSASGSAYILDVKSGLRVERGNDNDEYIAVSGIRNMRLNNGQAGWCSSVISFFKLTEDNDGNASFTEENLTINANHSLPYSPVQMAVGDFTGDGITNQLAVITSDADAIWLTLYTLRKNSSNALEAVKTKEEKVYTYATVISAINGFFALPVADVAAGDFDGDGKTELAVVYKNDRTNVPAKGYMPQAIAIRGSAVISIYKWSNGAFKTGSVTRDWNYSVSPFTEPDLTKSVSYMKPLAADLDGDGKHELALLTVQWRSRYSRFAWSSTYWQYDGITYMSLWACSKGSITPSPMGQDQYTSNPGWEFDSVAAEPGVHNVYSLAAGPFRGNMGSVKTCDDILVYNSLSAFQPYGGYYAAMLMWYDSKKSDNLGYTYQQKISTSDTPLTKIAADDFLHEGAELEEPAHFVVGDKWIPTASIQAPPYHFDTIQVPWGSYSGDWPVNFNYEPAAKTVYSRSSSTTDVKDTKFEATSSLEAFGPLGIEAKTGTMNLVRTGVKLAATYLVGKKEVGEAAAKIIKGLTDKIKATESALTNSSKTVGYTNTIEAGKTDSQLFYITRTHLWRYPVKKPVPSWLYGTLEKGNPNAASGDTYLTIVMPDQPSVGSSKSAGEVRQGLNAINGLYQPQHEEGNLFSYPTTLSAIPGYSARQFSLIPKVMPISYSTNQEKHKASVQTSSGKSESKSREVTSYGDFSKVVGTVKSLTGGSFDARPNTKSETFTKKFDSTEEVEVTYPDPNKTFDWRDVTFSSQFDMYVDESGIMKVAFAVTDLPESARLWGSNSPYWKKPDPSLVMPNRYVFMGEVRQDIGQTRQILARTERDAMKLRGVRIYSKTTSMYSNGIIYPGLSYEIHVPVYNASFLPSDGKTLTIPAKLYYRRAWSDETGTLIGTPTATTNVIGGWKKGTEDNKALLRFNWDNVPELQEGAYEFYVVLDPDKQIDEVHEAWTTQTPEGNNNGYYPFGISYGSKTSEELIAKDFQLRYKARSAKKTGTASAAFRAADNDNEYDDWSKWENVDDDTDFSEMVENDTEFAVSAVYAGADVRHEVWAEVLMDFTDDDGEEYTSSFGGEMFPLLSKGDRIEFSFLLNETEIQNGRNLRLTIADSGSYVEYIVDEKLSSDNTGDVPESEDIQPDEKLINEVITQSYELEKDAPVLWRLGNVTVSSDALLFEAAADDLVKVSVVPSDAETSPVSKVTVTASTIAGKTLEGVYRIPVQTSTDGSLWDEDIVLRFAPGSPDGQGGEGSWGTPVATLGSSGNSCGTLDGGIMLLLCAVMILKGKR